MNYKAEDFFMMRTPMFSKDFYKRLFSNSNKFIDNISELIKDSIFMEGIQIASPDLFDIIKKTQEDGKNIVDNKKVINSLLKYAIRASTRTTPFGIFSGFDICYFSDRTDLHLETKKKYLKRARADMEWINGIVKRLENDKSAMQKIKVYSNSILYKKGDRLINPYSCSENIKFQKDLNISASIRFTKQVKNILKICENGIEYGYLKKLICTQNSEIDSSIIENFIWDLYKNDYIISELRMPKSNINPVEFLLNILQQNKIETQLYEQLKEIDDLTNIYNKSLVGEGSEIFYILQKKMKKLFNCRNYLQVDLKLETENSSINSRVKHECEKVATNLINIARCIDDYPNIRDYKKLFFEKYGPYMEVPILELLDPELGLGAPAGYTLPSSERVLDNKKYEDNNFGAKDIKEYLLSKIAYTNYSGIKDVIFTDEDIISMNSMLSKYGNNNFPTSFDMNFFIFSKSKEDIDKGNYKLAIGPNVGADRAGRTLGRFADMMNDEEKKLYNDLYYKSKELLGDECILVEIIEEPLSSRVGNVIMNQNDAEYHTTIGSISNKNLKEIKLNDIVIGIDLSTNHFYIKSRYYNKRIKYTVFNMLNPVGSSNIYRFLREVSSYGDYNFIQTIYGMFLDDLIYIPRIVYNNCILSPRVWKITFNLLGSPKNYNEFLKKFEKWKNNWSVPKRVYQKVLDNIMLLDLDNEIQLEELYRIVKKEGIIILIDYDMDEVWVNDTNNEKYYSECVLSFFGEKKNTSDFYNIGKSQILNTKSDVSKNKCPITLQNDSRVLLPGDNGWWYLKLYCENRNIDSVICENILPFCENNVEKKIFDKFYFIRYSDPNAHIRLRIQLSDPNGNFNEIIFPLIKDLQVEAKLANCTINSYERELERYGGMEVFEYAEDFFYLDSLYVANLLMIKNEESKDELLAVASNLAILKGFNLSVEDQINYFENNFKELNLFKKEFKANTAEYINLIRELEKFPELKGMNFNNKYDSNILSNLFNKRNEKLKNYLEALQKQDEAGHLTNSLNDILLTLMHMHSNRFRGDTLWERKIIELTYRSLYAFKNYMTHNSLEDE